MTKTLKAVATAIETMTADSHLPEPGTVVISPGQVMIMPELPGAPISGLLVWAMHLEGQVRYEAEGLYKDGTGIATSVSATGKLGELDVTVLASTYRTMPKLLDDPPLTKLDVTEMELRELASGEEVLGAL